jgi:precorrin-6B methylase 2
MKRIDLKLKDKNKMKTLKVLIGLIFILFTFRQSKAQDYSFLEQVANLDNSPEEVMNAVGVKEGMIIGDIGAGRGRYTIPLAYRVGSSGKVFAVEINPARLDFIRYRCQRNNIQNVVTILGKSDDPLFPKEPLDMVFMVDVYSALKQFTEILLKIKPNLKPGGQIVMVYTFTKTILARLSRETKEAGFTYEKLENTGFPYRGAQRGWDIYILKVDKK